MKAERTAGDDATHAAATGATDSGTRRAFEGPPNFDAFVARLLEARVLPPAIVVAAIEDASATNFENDPPGERLRRYLLEHNLVSTAQLARLGRGAVGGVHLGPYLLLKTLGAGATGRVFLAEHTQIERRFALKVLSERAADDPTVHRRFLREAHVFLGLEHPNVVRAFELGEACGRPYLALEYVEGENLRDRVVRAGPLAFVQAASFVAQAAGALAHLHAQGFVHRDVKPSNLVATRDGRVKLIDLGLVCGGRGHASILRSDDAHASGGSVDYIAPEQIHGFHDVDPRADLYALGATLHCLLTGTPPFVGGTPSEKLERHLNQAPPAVEARRPDAPRFLSELCAAMLEKNPADRPASAGEVRRRIVHWLRTAESAAPAVASSEPRKRVRERKAVLDLGDVARYLRLPADAVEAMAVAGELPGRCVSGEWRFHRRAVVAWLHRPGTTVTNLGSGAPIEIR